MARHFYRRDDRFASASEVARLLFCERQVALDRIYGPKATPQQQQRRAEGERAHERFHRDALAAGHPRDFARAERWCFVANLAFGPRAPETAALRRFRDDVLRPRAAGRAAIVLYYRASPALCRLLATRPWALAACRLTLRYVAVPLAAVAIWLAARSKT